MTTRSEVAEPAALRAENTRPRGELNRRERECEAVRQVTEVFASVTGLDATRTNLAATIAGLLDAERCVVVTLEPGTRTLIARAPG